MYSYITSLKSRGSKPGLERISAALAELGDPQDIIPVIHVSGTNGKGSFSYMTASVLSAAGYKTGAFTSPYLADYRECFSINGEIISEGDFELLGNELIGVSERHQLTEYEFLTVFAYYYFYKKKADVAVIECCMGGLLDATNVVKKPLLSVITGVALDHMNFLGGSIGEIARHKAGIIKEGCPVLAGKCPQSAMKIISEKADELESQVTKVDYRKVKIKELSLDGMTLSHPELGKIRLSLSAAYQKYNAANVIEACRILTENGLRIAPDDIKRAFSDIKIPARFEIISRDPVVIYDGSHNPDGAESFESSYRALFGERKCVLLMGVMADKDHRRMAEILKPSVLCAFTVRPDSSRSLDPVYLAEEFQEIGVRCGSFDDFEDGLKRALDTAKAENAPLAVIGSLYMYKEFKSFINNLLLN